MKCFGLATKSGNTPFSWHIPGNSLFGLFSKVLSDTTKKEITDFCDAQVQTAQIHYFNKDNYWFSVYKVKDNCCIVAADCKLNASQMSYLYLYLFDEKITMVTAASDLEKYTQNEKISEINETLEETKQLMKNNIDLMLQRQEKIEDLTKRSEVLAQEAQSFKHKAQELNSCCIIL
ncbi:R-SNARE family protein [Legionella lytica]|uniref:R-SNARE family protein n=1 Tax=Legionella lytica TaxID=96232 RepID=A0ABW8DB94_9GAMM